MRKRFGMRALFALIAIGLLMGSMGGAFRVGMWQGYQVGRATAPGEEGDAPDWGPYWAPYGRPFGYGRMPYGHFGGSRPFGLLRPVLTFVLMVFLFGLAAKAFGFWAWKRAWKKTGKDWRRAWACGYPLHGHWHGPPHAPHGPTPPWGCADAESSDEETTEEQVAKVKPDADAAEDEG